jgi:hypothetical protein
MGHDEMIWIPVKRETSAGEQWDTLQNLEVIEERLGK